MKKYFAGVLILITIVGTVSLIRYSCGSYSDEIPISIEHIQQRVFAYGGLIQLSDSCITNDGWDYSPSILVFNFDSTFYYYTNDVNSATCALGRYKLINGQLELNFGSIVTQKRWRYYSDIPTPISSFSTLIRPKTTEILYPSWCGDKIKLLSPDQFVTGVQIPNGYEAQVTLLREEGLIK